MTQEQAGWTSYTEYRQRFEGKEQQERMEWERARWMMFQAMRMHPYIKPLEKPATPQMWIRFPWEKAVAFGETSAIMADEQAELDRLLNEYMEKSRNITS